MAQVPVLGSAGSLAQVPVTGVASFLAFGAGPKKLVGPAPQIGLPRNAMAQVDLCFSDLRQKPARPASFGRRPAPSGMGPANYCMSCAIRYGSCANYCMSCAKRYETCANYCMSCPLWKDLYDGKGINPRMPSSMLLALLFLWCFLHFGSKPVLLDDDLWRGLPED